MNLSFFHLSNKKREPQLSSSLACAKGLLLLRIILAFTVQRLPFQLPKSCTWGIISFVQSFVEASSNEALKSPPKRTKSNTQLTACAPIHFIKASHRQNTVTHTTELHVLQTCQINTSLSNKVDFLDNIAHRCKITHKQFGKGICNVQSAALQTTRF